MLLGLKLNRVQLALLSVYAIVAVDMFGTTLVIPVMSLYSQYLGATQAQVGILYACFSGGAFFSSLFMGRLSDHYGRRNIFLYCGFGAFLGFAGSGYAQTFPQFVCWRLVAGLFTGTMGNAFAYVSDVVPDNMRAVYMSYVTAVMSTCLVIGPLIGGGLAVFGIRVPYHAAAVIALCGLLLTYSFVEEPEVLFAKKDDAIASTSAATSAGSSVKGYNNSIGGSSISTGYQAISQVEEGGARNSVEMTSTLATAAASTEESAPLKPAPQGVSPWLNPRALLIGGVCTFLNTLTFTGIACLMPLILMEPSFGIVKDLNNVAVNESQRISLFLGYILGMFGLIQAVGMVYLFPFVNKCIGLLSTGAIGAAVLGVAFLSVATATREQHLVPVYVFLAIGNCLIRPVIPAYLGSIAPAGRAAEYISINSTFSNLGMMSAANLTALYATSHSSAIYATGSCSLLTAVILIAHVLYLRCAGGSNSAPVKAANPIRDFFDFEHALSEREFWEELVAALKSSLERKRYVKALECTKGQALVKEMLLAAMPELPETFDDRMEALYHLYIQLGHEDWANDMAGVIGSLKHHRVELNVPGIA